MSKLKTIIERTDLKPCPFCGGKAEIRRGGKGNASAPEMSWVACTRCGARTEAWTVSASYASDEMAVNSWNRRPEDLDELLKVSESGAETPQDGAGAQENTLPSSFTSFIEKRFVGDSEGN